MNLPNILTLTRFALIPFYVLVVFCNRDRESGILTGMIIFAIAGLTDLLDGYIARKYNMVTTFGKLMDPLADKLMLITVLISLTILQLIPHVVLIIVIFKEFLIILGALFLYNRRKTVVQANIFGKTASASFFLAVAAIVFDFPFSNIFLYIAILTALLALLQYFYIAFMKTKSE